jgi:hypothetical protein
MLAHKIGVLGAPTEGLFHVSIFYLCMKSMNYICDDINESDASI